MKNYSLKDLFQQNNYGVIITPNYKDSSIEDIDLKFLINKLAESGVVILRNFQSNLELFSDLIIKCSSKLTCDPARESSTKSAQLIKAGNVEMGLHIENGNLPFLPELQWFYCETPPNNGSETIFCDGYLLWDKLSPNVKDIFDNREIRYCRRIPEKIWKNYLAGEFELPVDQINENHLKKVCELVPGQRYELNSDNSVISNYITSALNKSIFSSKKAFANSMMGPSVNYEPPKITWSDGSIISPDLLTEIINFSSKYTDELSWMEGDIVIVDNMRVMHGRRKVLDTKRKIYGGQSFLKRELYTFER